LKIHPNLDGHFAAEIKFVNKLLSVITFKCWKGIEKTFENIYKMINLPGLTTLTMNVLFQPKLLLEKELNVQRYLEFSLFYHGSSGFSAGNRLCFIFSFVSCVFSAKAL
jgi:hypothetical protein